MKTEDEIDAGKGVILDFSANGQLSYTIRQADKNQIINLVYHVAGDQLVTDQPSAPRQERTRYSLDGDMLILENEGLRSWFSRQQSEET